MGRIFLLVVAIRSSLSLLTPLNGLQSNLSQILALAPRGLIVVLRNRPIWVIDQFHVVDVWIVADGGVGSDLLLGQLWLRRFPVVSLLNLTLFDALLLLNGGTIISLVILPDDLALVVIMTLVVMPSLLILNDGLSGIIEIYLFNTLIGHILLVLHLNLVVEEVFIVLLLQLLSGKVLRILKGLRLRGQRLVGLV